MESRIFTNGSRFVNDESHQVKTPPCFCTNHVHNNHRVRSKSSNNHEVLNNGFPGEECDSVSKFESRIPSSRNVHSDKNAAINKSWSSNKHTLHNNGFTRAECDSVSQLPSIRNMQPDMCAQLYKSNSPNTHCISNNGLTWDECDSMSQMPPTRSLQSDMFSEINNVSAFVHGPGGSQGTDMSEFNLKVQTIDSPNDKQLTDWNGVMQDLFYNLDTVDMGM